MMLIVGQMERAGWEVETGISQVPRRVKVGWLEPPFLGAEGGVLGPLMWSGGSKGLEPSLRSIHWLSHLQPKIPYF